MRIRRAIKLAVAGAVGASPLMVWAMGTPLSVHGAWSVDSSGNINASNPAGMTCAATDTAEAGFLQQQCSDGARTYIRTIVAEGATGDSFASSGMAFFGDESFVVVGGTGGLSGRQKMVQGQSDTLTSNARLNTGGEFTPMTTATTPEALAAAPDMIELDQSITGAANEFTTSFDFDNGVYMDSDNNEGGQYRLLTLRQNNNEQTASGDTDVSFDLQRNQWENLTTTAQADLGATGPSWQQFAALDVSADLNAAGITQSFDQNERSGTIVSSSGTATFADGATATFAAGDELARLLIGQDVDGAGGFAVADFTNRTQTSETGGMNSFISSGPLLSVSPDPFGTF